MKKIDHIIDKDAQTVQNDPVVEKLSDLKASGKRNYYFPFRPGGSFRDDCGILLLFGRCGAKRRSGHMKNMIDVIFNELLYFYGVIRTF